VQYYVNLTIFFRTVIGLRGKDGVVFAVEKLVTSKLYEPGANRRIFSIDRNIGMVSVSGIMNNNVHHIMFLVFCFGIHQYISVDLEVNDEDTRYIFIFHQLKVRQKIKT
jgi:hypothetical protein